MLAQQMCNIFRMRRRTNFKLGTQKEQGQTWSRSQGHVTHLTDKSRTKRPRNTKIVRKVAHLTGNKAYQFQGQGSRSSGRLMLRPVVRHIFRTERPTNFKLGTQMKYEDPYHR